MEFRMLVFVEGEKLKDAEKKPLEQGENHHWAILTPTDLILQQKWPNQPPAPMKEMPA